MKRAGTMGALVLQDLSQVGMMEMVPEEFMDALNSGLIELEGSKNGVVKYRNARWQVYESDGKLALVRL